MKWAPYVSHEPLRREEWRSHPHAEGVRRSIRYTNAYGRSLRIFAQGVYPDGRVFFLEVPRDQWAETFGEGA